MRYSSDRLSFYRKKAGLSQAKLAELVGVDTIDIINYENGTEEPRMDIFSKIVRACGFSADELTVFGGKKQEGGINSL